MDLFQVWLELLQMFSLMGQWQGLSLLLLVPVALSGSGAPDVAWWSEGSDRAQQCGAQGPQEAPTPTVFVSMLGVPGVW